MKYQYWLNNIEGIGCQTIQKLIGCFGSAKGIYEASEEKLKEANILLPHQLQNIINERYLGDWPNPMLLKKQIKFTTYEKNDYPEKLRNIQGVPYGLYYRGRLPQKDEKTVAIVGARRCSAYGKAMAEELAYELAGMDYHIVSGMAKGIDTWAHKGCLKRGKATYAVLGCGIDICYPKENYLLYDEILEQGGIMSEYPPGQEPLAQLFPPRNRIISGLADMVIVVEAKEKSGSLITTDFALEQGRDIYVVPGRMTDPMSAGCNRLINQGAGIICSVESFLRDLSDLSCGSDYLPHNLGDDNFFLEKEETLVYSCFDFYPKSIDNVQRETEMDLLALLAVIMHLCELGLIQECFKNQYIRIR